MFKQIAVYIIVIITALALIVGGCSTMTPAKKPESGPTGKPTEAKPNPPLLQRFQAPPPEMYDLETLAGKMFEDLNNANWSDAQSQLSSMRQTWTAVKPSIGDKMGVPDADDALKTLENNIANQKNPDAYQSLNKFMGSLSEIGKSYKLSPVSDLIALGNTVRNVAYYAKQKDWKSAGAKAKEMEGTWSQAKPVLESFGVLGQITRTHLFIKQIKDAVESENKDAVNDLTANINDSLGKIKEYYKGK